MVQRRSDENQRSRGRSFATYLLLLFPGFMFLGFLAPAAVTVRQNTLDLDTTHVYRSFAIQRPMKLTWNDSKLPDMADVESLFSGARFVTHEGEDVPPLPPVQAGQDIELAEEDAVEDYVSDTLFDESLDRPVMAVDLKQIWDPAVFDIIPPLIYRWGYTQYDDFPGLAFAFGPPVNNVVIPEPAPAMLLGLGLVALALRARRNRD